MLRKVEGKLFALQQHGTNEYLWTVCENIYGGGQRLHILEEGDHLTVFRSDEAVRFAGYIKKDTETAKIPRPHHPELPRQFALGCWVYWIQEGWNPDEWALLFFTEFKAVLLTPEKKAAP